MNKKKYFYSGKGFAQKYGIIKEVKLILFITPEATKQNLREYVDGNGNPTVILKRKVSEK